MIVSYLSFLHLHEKEIGLVFHVAVSSGQSSVRGCHSVTGLNVSSEINCGFALWQGREKWRKQVFMVDAGLSHIVSHGT